jgi:hypothetical protein
MLEYIFSLEFLVILLLILIILYLLSHPEKIEKLNAKLSMLFVTFTEKAELGAVAYTIQSTINVFTKEFNQEIDNLLPYGVKIEWVKNVDRKTFLENNMIIIRMESHNNNSRNLVHATLTYLSQGLIREARPYIESNILKSIDFVTAKKLFINNQDYNALQYFSEDYILPAQDESEELKRNLQIMDILDDRGIFSRILLNEFKIMGLKLQPRGVNKSIRNETRDFIIKLHEIAEKERGIDIDTSFNGEHIKASIVLVGKKQTLKYGTKPYISHINSKITEGYNSIYLLASGRLNIEVAKIIITILDKNINLNKVFEHHYVLSFEGRTSNAICVYFNKKVNLI